MFPDGKEDKESTPKRDLTPNSRFKNTPKGSFSSIIEHKGMPNMERFEV